MSFLTGLLAPKILLSAILALSLGGGLWIAKLKINNASLKNTLAKAELTISRQKDMIDKQNELIDIFRDEARIMGENLKKAREKALESRKASTAAARAMLELPPEKTCHKGLGAATRRAQGYE